MSASSELFNPELSWDDSRCAGQDVRERVWSVLAELQSHRVTHERRRDCRFPYPHPVWLTPLDAADTPQTSETFSVLGRHLSERGLDFYHTEPVPHRRVIVSFENEAKGLIGMETELTWCRFRRHHWYENGGRFLRCVESPLMANERRMIVAVRQPH